MISTKKTALFFSFIGLISSVVLLLWLAMPQPQGERIFHVPEVEFFNPNVENNGLTPIFIPEGIQARLIMPEHVWLGRTAEIELVVEPSAAVEYAGSGLLENHNLIAEARIDWPLMRISPKDAVSQPFGLSRSIRFNWHIIPDQVGQLEGQFWFYLQRISIETERMDRQALLSAPITIQTVSILNMTYHQVQIVLFGALGIFAILFFRLFHKSKSRNRA